MSDFDPITPLERLDCISALMEKLARAQGDLAAQQELSERIRRELALHRHALEPFLKKRSA